MVEIVVQVKRSGLDCSVKRIFGVVLRKTVVEVLVVVMAVKMGDVGVGRLPPVPLKVTAPV